MKQQSVGFYLFSRLFDHFWYCCLTLLITLPLIHWVLNHPATINFALAPFKAQSWSTGLLYIIPEWLLPQALLYIQGFKFRHLLNWRYPCIMYPIIIVSSIYALTFSGIFINTLLIHLFIFSLMVAMNNSDSLSHDVLQNRDLSKPVDLYFDMPTCDSIHVREMFSLLKHSLCMRASTIDVYPLKLPKNFDFNWGNPFYMPYARLFFR